MAITQRLARRAARSLGAVAALTALLVGVPWALAHFVGWPLPTTLPTWGQVTDALNGASISDTVLIKSLACATWVLWLMLAACFLVEARAWARGREAREVPLASVLQPFVRELVVSATLLVGSLRPAGTAPALRPPVPTVTLTLVAPAVFTSALDAPAATDATAPLPTCTVVPRDSLWKLAEEHLGDGLRWRDIWELNQGRTFPDGRHFLNPNLIQPGWQLVMPADAAGLAPAGVEPATPPAAPGVSPPPAPASTPPPSTTLAPPTTLPAVDAPSDNGTGAAHAPAEPADDPDFPVAPLLAGSSLVAAGVIAALSRLRRRQLRHRTPGHAPRLPDTSSRHAEVHLRRAAADAPFERVDLVLRVFASCLGRRRASPCPAIAAVSVGPEAVEILLSDGVAAPNGPFTVAAGGRAWTLPASVPDDELRPIADTHGGPAPALVTVGTVDERSVLIDLEAGGRTLVGGDAADAQRLLWTMAVDLATSNRADDLNVILCGAPPEGLEVLRRVRTVDDLDTVIHEIEAEGAAVTAELLLRRRTSTLDARAADPIDPLTPTVVLVTAASDSPTLDRLLEIAGHQHGLAVVVAGDVEGEFDRELCVEDDTLIVKPIGLHLAPASLPGDVLAATRELVRAAADLAPGEQLDLDLDLRSSNGGAPAALSIGPHRAPLEFDARGQPIVPSGHVLVRVLGPVEIVGGQQPIDRRRSIELVVYLALHPHGVDDVRLRDVLWPEGAPTQAAFNETVSRARRMLGLDAEGTHHLLPVDNRHYRVGRYVATDAMLLEECAAGRGSPDVLRLVRGLPFERTERGYEWAYDEGQAHRLAALIDETRLCSDSDDLSTAPAATTAR